MLLDSLVGTSGFVIADVLRFGLRVDLPELAFASLLLSALFGTANRFFGLHRRVWRHVAATDIVALAKAVGVTTAAFSWLDVMVRGNNRMYWLSTVPNGAALAFLLLLVVKLRLRTRKPCMTVEKAPEQRVPETEQRQRVLIVGSGHTAAMLADELRAHHRDAYKVVAFVDDDAATARQRIRDIPVAGQYKDIARLTAALDVTLIAIAASTKTTSRLDHIVALCHETGVRVQIVPSLSEMVVARQPAPRLRDLNVADLLMRDEVMLDVVACSPYLRDRVVMVTGAAGSIGMELCRQLVRLQPRCLILLDVNETGLFDLRAELQAPGTTCGLIACIADITDEVRVNRVFARYVPHVVFHAAAYKHVPLLEDHAYEAVLTNVQGTANLCRAAAAHRVERFVFISSDKAAQPANNLGYTKRIGELLVRAHGQESDTIFCAVRFGNVIGSRGSVVPTFAKQIAAGGPVTVTHPEATRFFMTVPEAACLVIEAAATAVNGSLFMLDMGAPVSIVALATRMIHLHGLRVDDVRIEFIGLRPGEKIHEVLTTAHEVVIKTEHAKIMRIADDTLVAWPPLERAVRDLVTVALRTDDAATVQMLALAATGCAAPRPLCVTALKVDDARSHSPYKEDVTMHLIFSSCLDEPERVRVDATRRPV